MDEEGLLTCRSLSSSSPIQDESKAVHCDGHGNMVVRTRCRPVLSSVGALEPHLTVQERQPAHMLSIMSSTSHIERQEGDLVVVISRVQQGEIRQALAVVNDAFTIEQQGAGFSGRDHAREALGPFCLGVCTTRTASSCFRTRSRYPAHLTSNTHNSPTGTASPVAGGAVLRTPPGRPLLSKNPIHSGNIGGKSQNPHRPKPVNNADSLHNDEHS